MVENETENDLENALDFKIDKWGFDKSSKWFGWYDKRKKQKGKIKWAIKLLTK
jgi:hypothetical protein